MKAKLVLAAAAMLAAGSAQAATTIPYTFNTVGNTGENGQYGNVMAFNTTPGSTLKLNVTAWQINKATGAVTSAYLGAYGGGLGVTGLGDNKGAGLLHQIDDSGDYLDFVLLDFNRAVTLGSVKTNSYGIDGVYDNDAFWYDASSGVNGTVAAGASDALRATGAAVASSKWAVGASGTDRFADGFKLAAVTVSEQVAAVPEPATWATMILGFGVAGASLRRTRRRPVAGTAALA